MTLAGYFNGVKVQSSTLPTETGLGSLLGGGNLVLGQRQSPLTSGYEIEESYSGKLTEVNVWNTVLSDTDISGIASCTSKSHNFHF